VLFFAVDLRAVVRFAAAGATSCPQACLGNGTVLMAMLTPSPHAFPHLPRCLFARVACTRCWRNASVSGPLVARVTQSACAARQTQAFESLRSVRRDWCDAPTRREKNFARNRASAAD
jgi:hypothetical protein